MKRSIWFFSLLVGIAATAFAAEPAAAPAAPKAPPVEVKLGAYVVALYDLNPTNNTFAADLWLWALHDKERDLKPLKTLEPENARTFATSLDATEDHGAQRYHATKVRGVFSQNWDVTNFPFDRHELRIRLSESQAEADQFVYAADTANTGIDPLVRLEGWRIEKVALAASTRTFATSFGEPDSTGGSTYAQAVLSIFVVRDAMGLFWKLLAAVYVAFLVSMVSFLLDTSKDGFFSSRVAMLVGMVFAVVVNTQRIASTLGQTSAFTLAEKLHIVTLLELLAALLCTLYARRLHTTNRGNVAERIDRRMAVALGATYVLVNGAMIVHAAHAH